jgi:hypothetical protein
MTSSVEQHRFHRLSYSGRWITDHAALKTELLLVFLRREQRQL